MNQMFLKEKILGKTGLKVKTLGFGGIPIQRISEKQAVRVVRRCYELGINYYDTAIGYTVSEERIGKALKDVRENAVIATKTHAETREEVFKDLETSLNHLQTDYVDIYQLHGVSSKESWKRISGAGGALEAFYEAKDQGRICHIGITGHNTDVLKEIVEEDIFETVLVQLNYLAPEPLLELLPLCKKMNVGTVIMKPFAGGALSDASTALKFLLAKDSVDVVIPGMQSLEEVEKNVAVAAGTYSLTPDEEQSIEKDLKELGGQFCRGCDYCQPCPQSIPISSVLRSESTVKRMGLSSRIRKQLEEGLEKANSCAECGICEERCPYDLPIRELLRTKRRYIAELLEE
jgi:predicted aldo/keto reductase-like oxidoreductase